MLFVCSQAYNLSFWRNTHTPNQNRCMLARLCCANEGSYIERDYLDGDYSSHRNLRLFATRNEHRPSEHQHCACLSTKLELNFLHIEERWSFLSRELRNQAVVYLVGRKMSCSLGSV